MLVAFLPPVLPSLAPRGFHPSARASAAFPRVFVLIYFLSSRFAFHQH